MIHIAPLVLSLYLPIQVGQQVVDNPTSILSAVIGLGTLIVSGLLVALRTIWKSSQAKDVEIRSLYEANSQLSEKLLRDTLTVTMDAAGRLEDSSKTLEAAMLLIHQATAKSPSSKQYVELTMLLRELADRRRQ